MTDSDTKTQPAPRHLVVLDADITQAGEPKKAGEPVSLRESTITSLEEQGIKAKPAPKGA